MNSTLASLVALSLVLVACGGDAGDPPAGGTVAELDITIEHPDRDTVTYQVICLGDTATITGDATEVVDQGACAALSSPDVVARLVNGPPADQACTEIYGGPDEASITGTIDGQPADALINRANGCGMADWDDLLSGVLPTAAVVTG